MPRKNTPRPIAPQPRPVTPQPRPATPATNPILKKVDSIKNKTVSNQPMSLNTSSFLKRQPSSKQLIPKNGTIPAYIEHTPDNGNQHSGPPKKSSCCSCCSSTKKVHKSNKQHSTTIPEAYTMDQSSTQYTHTDPAAVNLDSDGKINVTVNIHSNNPPTTQPMRYNL